MTLLVALLAGYALGSFPSAYLVARVQQRDIYRLGSGNMGAMNTARNLGLAWGLLVLLLDVLKGALAALLGLTLGGLLPALIAANGAVLGHAWPLFTRFRGGKALACAFGCSLPLYPLGGLAGLALIVTLTLALRRRPTLAAVLMVASYPLLVWAVLALQSRADALPISLSLLPMAGVVIYKHLPSLHREQRAKG
jgi:acyl phosphate:glycerol-3-phosphate acyltransferase